MRSKPNGLPFWLDIDRPTFPRLEGDLTTDIAIIGAGIAGLKLARALAQYGFKTVILEGNQVGEGASGRNQGSINHGPGLSYAECTHLYSRQTARDLWRLGLENHRLLRAQIQEYEIDCDYQVDGMVSLARRDMPGFEATLRQYQTDALMLQEDGFHVAFHNEAQAIQRGGSPLYAGALEYLDDGQFHSGKYIVGLAQGVARDKHISLYEYSRVRSITPDGSSSPSAAVRIVTDHGNVTTPHVFLATNALVPQFVPSLEPGLRAERGQAFVTELLAERPCTGSFGTAMAWWREIIEPGGRFRLLFGGGRKREEPDSLFPQYNRAGQPHPKLEPEGFSPSETHQHRLDVEFNKLFPHLSGVHITHRWGGLQCFTADELPMVGVFDPARHLHGMAGFSGRGNCWSDVGAAYLAGQVAGSSSPIEREYGALMRTLMAVGRPQATWPAWSSPYDE
ncbi:MAG: FAD-binding oxidoreductase [Chloroflexi bacterium]|nr:FAD-binding oxidoreductase [Chloroflexota bacterium]